MQVNKVRHAEDGELFDVELFRNDLGPFAVAVGALRKHRSRSDRVDSGLDHNWARSVL